MPNILRELRKHLLIYGLFLKNSLIAQMEYRFNFVGNLAMETGYLFVKLSYVVVIYRSGVKINGRSPDEILLFIGTFIALTAVYAGLFMINNFRLCMKIKDGDLDLLLTKPVSLYTLGGYLGFMLISALVSYSLFLLPQILSFWLINTSAIAEVTDSFWDFNNMPMDIYNTWIKQVGVFVLPIFVISDFPPLFLLGRMSLAYLSWSALLPLILLMRCGCCGGAA
jgi:ABC-2 type transport system permease protein